MIDDVAVRGGRVRILSVDGRPVERAHSKYVTVVPVALVEPGTHNFVVLTEGRAAAAQSETLSVFASVMAGKRYRFEMVGRGPRLTEYSEKEAVEWRDYALAEVRTLGDVPPAIRSRLGVDHPGLDGVADRRRPFNATDVIVTNWPMRRFLAGGHDGDVWLVALERGGRGYSIEVFLFSGPNAELRQKWVLMTRPKTLREITNQLP